MAEGGLRIALLGAESTGKSTLGQALHTLLSDCGFDCAWVPEGLRDWCAQRGRTPRADEQAAIAAEQAAQVAQAARRHALVLADTTPLMTAVYSELLFQDPSLYPDALAHQQAYALNLLTGLDLPWVADGLQRDGPQVREPVDALLRQRLAQQRLSYQVVYGTGPRRLHNAVLAVSALPGLQAWPEGLARLRAHTAAWRDAQALNRPWRCEHCSDGDCEHRLFTGLLPRPA